MITDTMSYADIAKELEEDYKNVVRYQIHLPVKKYMKEVLNRPNGKLLFKTMEWTSPRHNKMLLTPLSRNKKETRENGPFINVCCVFLYKGELNMAVYSHTVLPWIHVQFFTHHFFQRYNERYLHDSSLQMMDIVKHFIRSQFVESFFKIVEHPKLGMESFTIFPNGCSFSEIADYDPYILHHTFVSFDILHTEQLLNLAELLYDQRLDNYPGNKSDDNFLYEKRRVENFKKDVATFPMLKADFQKRHENFRKFSELCFHLSVDILDLTEGMDNPVLHQFGKRLLDISALPEKQRKAELMKL